IRPDEMVGENVRIGAAQAQLLEDPLRELMQGFGVVRVVSSLSLGHGIHTVLYEPRNSRRCRSTSRVGSPAATDSVTQALTAATSSGARGIKMPLGSRNGLSASV